MSSVTISDPTTREDDVMSAEEFLDRELGSMHRRPSAIYLPDPAPAPAHAVAPSAPDAETPRDRRSKVLPRLLAMADSYLRAGSIRQALEMYFDLYRNHEDSPEAAKAEDRILEVASIHEENGELHLARAIYEQLI